MFIPVKSSLLASVPVLLFVSSAVLAEPAQQQHSLPIELAARLPEGQRPALRYRHRAFPWTATAAAAREATGEGRSWHMYVCHWGQHHDCHSAVRRRAWVLCCAGGGSDGGFGQALRRAADGCAAASMRRPRPKVRMRGKMVSVSVRVGGGSVPVRVWVQVEVRVQVRVWVRVRARGEA